MNGMDSRAFIGNWREELNKEKKDMTKDARVTIKRICEELMKWCEERHVMCEFASSDDEGLSATFTVGGTTLSVSHIELRDADEFSRYVKSVMFGVDDVIIDSLKTQVEDLKKEDEEKAKDIEYLEKELEKLRNENAGLKYQLKILAEDDATMDALKKKNATLQYKIDALEGDIVDITTSFKKNLEAKKKENLDLDNNVKDMFAALRSLKKENAGLKDANSFLSVKLEKRDEIIEALKVSNEELKAEIEILLKKNHDLDNHVKNLERERSENHIMGIDELKSLDEHIAWITDHLENAENDFRRSMEKLEEDQRKLFYDELNIFTRLAKLEEAQPKKSEKKTNKKTQKSTLS